MLRQAVAIALLAAAGFLMFGPGTRGPEPGSTTANRVDAGAAPAAAGAAGAAAVARAQDAGTAEAAERILVPGQGSGERTRQLRIEVVDPEGRPVPRAEVLWADEVSLRGAARDREPLHFADRLRAWGEIATSDEEGVPSIRVAGSHLAVHGRRDRLTGDAVFRLEDGVASYRLTLEERDFLSCIATWEDGQPASEVPLVLCWETAPASEPDLVAQLDLGRTDASGRLVWPGWARMARAVAGDPGQAGRIGRAGPHVPGADAAFVPVTAAAGQQIAITVPRFAFLRVRIHDAAGHPLDWSSVPLTVRGAGDQAVCVVQVAAGRAVFPAVVGAVCDWRLGQERKAHGRGRIEVPAAGDEVQLRCQDVVRLVGRVHPPGGPLLLRMEPRGRAAWECSVAATADGAFDLPVSRHDSVKHFTIVARGQETIVGIPPLEADQIDLGVVMLDARVFAVLGVRDDAGTELQQVMVDASVAGRPVPCVVVATQDGRELRMEGAVASAVLVVASPGHRTEQITAHRGDRLRIVLARESEFEAVVRLSPDTDASSVWVRKARRWSASRQEFVMDDQWAPLQRQQRSFVARLKGAHDEICQLQVWSLKPPGIVVDVERRLGVDGLELDATRLRTIPVQIDGSGSGYLAALESDWLSEDWLKATRLPFGADHWTLPVDEPAVVLAAAGAVPRRVPVAGTALHVRLDPLPPQGVLGLPDATALVGIAPSVPARRVRTFADGMPSAWRAGSLADLGQQVVLPLDYAVVVGGARRTARWRGGGWAIE
jgi:hypothetical protein